MKIEPICIELVDYMGGDTNIVNAARVSFNKSVHSLGEKDIGLLRYLAKHKHWSPFAHTSISLRCTAPIFLARQLVKHQVGGVWNEVSRRYVDSEPTFYIPDVVHTRAENAKQGCGDTSVDSLYFTETLTHTTAAALDMYTYLVSQNVAPEEARMVLPLNTMTEWIWTGSLMFWFRVWKQRSDAHAQTVAREFADLIDTNIPYAFKESWKALKEYYE